MGFEADVRRIAEAVWGLLPGQCQPMHYADNPAVREIDGVARLRDVTHLLMVTTSTRLDKVKEDCKKLAAAESVEKHTSPAVSKWLITEKQLDAQHIEHARQNNVIALTKAEFQSRFFDSRKYIQLRNVAAFGSARDPKSNSINLPADAYVALPMSISFSSDNLQRQVGKKISIEQIGNRIKRGETIVLRAPFGSGKSLTTREVFRLLAREHLEDVTAPIPIALNLREHWGAEYSDEILERHARTIGYTPKEDLVVAWRAGMCALLIDGFDEVAAQVVAREDNKSFMREARRKALTGARDFTQKIPANVGVFICGRNHYFDSNSELISALGLSGKRFIIVDLGEFDDDNAQEYLQKNGMAKPLPDWLPRKPLLLGYLLKEGLLEEILSIDGSRGFGHAWNSFLIQICQREASLEHSVMEADTVRAVLERLAFRVRSTATGTGPITGTDLAASYTSETNQPAGEGVLAQLQRLPGVAKRDEEGEARSFVDDDLLAALQGSAYARFVLSAFGSDVNTPLAPLGSRATDMAAYVLQEQHASVETLLSVVGQLLSVRVDVRGNVQHAADCLGVILQIALQQERQSVDLRDAVFDGAAFDILHLDEIRVQNASFRNCTIQEVVLGEGSDLNSVSFTSCFIGKMTGTSTRDGLPSGFVSKDTEIEEFDNVLTNNAVLKLDISPQLKALLTVLRKLYKQAGGGRKISALTRGISGDVQGFIDPVLETLKHHNFITIQNSIVHSVRSQRARVDLILASPTICEDPLAMDVRQLQ